MWVIRAEISRAVLSSLALCISLGDRAEIYYIHVMRNSFVTEPARFVCSPVLDHPSFHDQDDTEVVLDWTRLEALMGEICAYTTGRLSHPFLALFRILLQGIWYKLSDEQLAASLARDLLFRHFCRFELFGDTPDATTLGRFANNSCNMVCGRGCWKR